MTHILRLRRLLGIGLCLWYAAAPAAAQDADVLGAWDVSVSAGPGPGTSAPLVLKRDGGKIVGTLSSPQGDQAVEASVRGTSITIWFSVRTQEGPIGVTMSGSADADGMRGTMDFGGRGQGQWTARRSAGAAPPQSAPARADVSGTWNFQVETAAGSGTPTMTFKQDGEKLTGQYTGQLGEAPLTGTVKGNAIDFTIDVTLEGNAFKIVYSGTVDQDSMKGTVKLGDLGDGTFTAKRKK